VSNAKLSRGQVQLTLKVSPAEMQAIDNAVRALNTTRSAIVRYMLDPVFRGYSVVAAENPSQFATQKPVHREPPQRNTLRYDPREYMRLWHEGQAKARARRANAVQTAYVAAGGDPQRLPGYISASDTDKPKPSRLLKE
jgi:hypothetical protein